MLRWPQGAASPSNKTAVTDFSMASAAGSVSWSTTTGEPPVHPRRRSFTSWLNSHDTAALHRPGCFWYEPVDLLRKLALTSLLQFVERGTAMQVPASTGRMLPAIHRCFHG